MSESQLEDMLFKSDPSLIQRAGIHQFFFTAIIRQLKLGKWGRADLVTMWRQEDELFVTVYELKKGTINLSVVAQAIRYCQALDILLRDKNPNDKIRISMVGVGNKIELSSDDHVLLDHLHYPFSCYAYNFNKTGDVYFTQKKGGFMHNQYPVTGDLDDVNIAYSLALKEYDNSAVRIHCSNEFRQQSALNSLS